MPTFVPNYVFLRGVLLHYFNMKKKAAETHRILVEIYGDGALAERTCQKWFARFKSGNFDLDDEERSGATPKFMDVELVARLDEDPSLTQEDLAKTLGVTQPAISHRLKAMGMNQKNFSNDMVDIVQKRDQWNDSPSTSADLTASCEKDSTPSTSKRAKSTTVSSSSSKRSASEAFSDVATNFDQDEDFNDLFIKIVGFKFRKLSGGQKVLAEKIINEVLFEAQLGHLTMQTKLVHSATSNNNSQMGASNYGILEEQLSPSVNIKSEHSLGSENYLDLGE